MAAKLEATIKADLLSGESAIPINKFAKSEGVSGSTILRWIAVGISDGRDGRLKLEAIRRGQHLLTTKSAYQRFLAAHPIEERGVKRGA